MLTTTKVYIPQLYDIVTNNNKDAIQIISDYIKLNNIKVKRGDIVCTNYPDKCHRNSDCYIYNNNKVEELEYDLQYDEYGYIPDGYVSN